jgi:hypothetical protein
MSVPEFESTSALVSMSILICDREVADAVCWPRHLALFGPESERQSVLGGPLLGAQTGNPGHAPEELRQIALASACTAIQPLKNVLEPISKLLEQYA